MSDKIKSHHLGRKAILYVRQSSTHQVMHNQESRLLQYAMRDRLCALARCAHGRTRLYRGRAAAAANAGLRASVITKPSSLVGSACLAIFEVLTAARKSRWRPDCLAGHVGLELRNVDANYPFERSHKFAGIQPNSGHGDHSRLSCSAGIRRTFRAKRACGVITDAEPDRRRRC